MSPVKRLAFVALLALTGCGFTPLYATDGSDDAATVPVAQKLEQVQVQNIPERPGQMLRQSIEDQLYLAGAPTTQRYSLAVAYSVISEGIGIQADTSVTRTRFVAIATWTLAPIGTPSAPLATGTASTEDAANVIDQQYFALTLETNTVNQQLADELGQQIATQLSAWFKMHPAV